MSTKHFKHIYVQRRRRLEIWIEGYSISGKNTARFFAGVFFWIIYVFVQTYVRVCFNKQFFFRLQVCCLLMGITTNIKKQVQWGSKRLGKQCQKYKAYFKTKIMCGEEKILMISFLFLSFLLYLFWGCLKRI